MAYFDEITKEIILSDEDKAIFKQCEEYVNGLKPDWMTQQDYDFEKYQANAN